jgi:hypothetical protein
MQQVWSPRSQGNAGEFSAMEWLTLAGATVLKPPVENPHYDLVADWGERIERLQVKTLDVFAPRSL